MTSRQRALLDLWEGFEQTEPDISTERLIEMVCQAGKATVDEVCEALVAELEGVE